MKYHIPMLYDEHNLKKQESSEFGSYMGKQDSNINIDVSNKLNNPDKLQH